MVNLYRLDQIRSDQLASVGFKALYLSRLVSAECPVLPGFVIASETFSTVLAQIQWASPLFADLPDSVLRLNIDNAQQLQAIAQHLRQAIAAAPVPPDLVQELTDVINHCSAPAIALCPSLSVPGLAATAPATLPEVILQPSSFINSYVCERTLASVMRGLNHIWADFWGAKSLFYWQRLNIPIQQVRLAVLVQPVQSAIAAGTMRAIQQNRVELCATTGLGRAIEQGEVLPDTYHLHPHSDEILFQQLGQKTIAYQIPAPGAPSAKLVNGLERHWLNEAQQLNYALTETHVQQLQHLYERVRTTLGMEIELEWVLQQEPEGGQAYITQVLPLSVRLSLPQPYSLPSIPSQAKRDVELFPDATLIATGLAAAPGQAIARANVLTDLTLPLGAIAPHTVLVAPTMPLDWLPLIQHAAGLVAEQGGLTSHSAIVARELGVPAVMGVDVATQQIQTGELIWVDGDRGRVYRLTKLPRGLEPIRPAPVVSASMPPASTPQTRLKTKLWLNLSQPEHLDRVAELAVDGVGLLRAELLALAVLDYQHPAQWLQQHSAEALVERLAAAIAEFATAFQPRPVLYRSFDLRSHEFSDPVNQLAATRSHPVLGLRGTFSYCMDATLFKLELLALRAVQQQGRTNLQLMLPFVRTVEEFQFCRELVQQAGLLDNGQMRLWMMAEVPSVLLLLPDYVKAGVQGISIGTNDLTQLLLGVDRDEAHMAPHFEARHPAVKRAIAQLIQGAKSLGIPCSICGEAPVQYPELIADLIQWGIDSISVAPDAVTATLQEMIRVEQQLQKADGKGQKAKGL